MIFLFCQHLIHKLPRKYDEVVDTGTLKCIRLLMGDVNPLYGTAYDSFRESVYLLSNINREAIDNIITDIDDHFTSIYANESKLDLRKWYIENENNIDPEDLMCVDQDTHDYADRILEVKGRHMAKPTHDLIDRLNKMIEDGDSFIELFDLISESATEARDEFTGDTMLHLAADHMHNNILDKLLDIGADPRAVNKYGYRPVDVSRSMDKELAEIQKESRTNPAVIYIFDKELGDSPTAKLAKKTLNISVVSRN